MVSLRMLGRCVVLVAAAVIGSGWTAVARAQIEPLPCDSASRGRELFGTGSILRSVGVDDPWLGFGLAVGWSHYEFDTYYGQPIDSASVDVATLSLVLALGHGSVDPTPGLVPGASYFSVSAPYLWIDGPAASGRVRESGPGDVEVGGLLAVGKKLWLHVAATLPTGDEERYLGLGDATLRAGLVLTQVKRRTGAATHQFTESVGYEFNGRSADLSRIFGGFAYQGLNGHWQWEAGLDVFAGTGPGSEIAGAHEPAPVDLEFHAALTAQLHAADSQGWFVSLGFRSALDEDSLSDTFTPSLAFGWR